MRKPKRLSAEALGPYLFPSDPLVGPPAPIAPIEWRSLFGNDNPVEVEVGFGKGLFLLTAGTDNPGTNYFGIEIVRKYQLFAATRIATRGLKNVCLACADARTFLRDRVRTASVRTVHLYFPDPWWKHRHQKRIVFTPEFAQEAERVLGPGCRLLVVTDVAGYAEMVRETVPAHTRLRETAPPPEKEPAHDMDYLTNFERKFRREGRPIHRMAWAKA